MVRVPAPILAQARETLEVLVDRLRRRVWSTCPCGQEHGQRALGRQVLDAAAGDLDLLERVLEVSGQKPGPAATVGR